MLIIEHNGDDHIAYLKSELNEIEDEKFREYYTKKFDLVEKVCNVLGIELPRLALSDQVNMGEAAGESLDYREYYDIIDRDTILIAATYETDENVNMCIAHELRHLWQFKNNFKMDFHCICSDPEDWKNLSQEIDADAFGLAYFRCFPVESITEEVLRDYYLCYDKRSKAYKKRVESAEEIAKEIKQH